jgi:hypothetical protein
LVFSIHDPTEVAIQKMIEASQRMLKVNSQGAGEGREGWGINPAIIVEKRNVNVSYSSTYIVPFSIVTL